MLIYIHYVMGEESMKNMYDVRQLLKKYGSFIYTGDQCRDLDLIKHEVIALYEANIISMNDYKQALLIIQQTYRSLSN